MIISELLYQIKCKCENLRRRWLKCLTCRLWTTSHSPQTVAYKHDFQTRRKEATTFRNPQSLLLLPAARAQEVLNTVHQL